MSHQTSMAAKFGAVRRLAVIACSVAAALAAPISRAEAAGDGAVKSIALSPGGGALGGAVAMELQRRGYTIVSLQPAVASLGSSMPNSGLDAVLAVKAVSDANGDPQTATAMIAAPDGHVLAKVNWTNYWGGWRGAKNASPQQTPHRNLAQAAHEIADRLAANPL